MILLSFYPEKYATKRSIPPNIEFLANLRTSTRLVTKVIVCLTGFAGVQNQLNFNSGKYVDCLVDITALRWSNFLISVNQNRMQRQTVPIQLILIQLLIPVIKL